MLTTGVRLRRNPAAQRELVEQLQAEGVSALGFGVGLGFDQVPPALVEVAKEREFPVFAVPYETPFREIIHFVDSSLSGGEEHVFRRLTALQRYLVDALRTPQPEQAMVDRLAEFLEASVVLVGADGRPEIVAGKPPVSALLAEVCDQPPGLIELEVDGWYAVATPVATQADQATRRLVLASPRRGFIGKLAKPAAEATAPLLAAMARLSDVVRDQEQAVKAALLAEALEPAEAHDPLPLAARAAAFGLDFSSPARLVVITRRGDAGTSSSRASAASWSPGSSRRHPAPRPPARGLADVLVQGGDDEVRALSDAFPEVVIGIGRAVTAIADAHHSLRDAELAADRLRARPGAAHHALRGLRPRDVPRQRDRARAARAQGRRDPVRAAGQPAAARGAQRLLRPRPGHRHQRRGAAHAPQLAALPARAGGAAARRARSSSRRRSPRSTSRSSRRRPAKTRARVWTEALLPALTGGP